MRQAVVFGGRFAVFAGLLLLARVSLASPTPSNTSNPLEHSVRFPDRAAHAWAVRDAEAALEACSPLLLEGPSTGLGKDRARCHLVAAAALLKKDEPARAASLLLPALAELGEERPWALLLLAEARLRAGELEELPALLEAARKIDPRGPLGKKSAELEALAWLQSPDRPGAEAALDRLLRAGHGDEARLRLALARHHLARDRKEEAIRNLLVVWRGHPERAEAEEAARTLESLEVEPSWADRKARIERLLSQGRPARALEELAGASEGEALFLRGRALMDAGERAEAEKVLLAHLRGEPPNRAETLILLGRLAARREDLAQAVAHLDEAARLASGRAAAEAAFLAAFLHYDFGRWDDAIRRFDAYAKAYAHRREEAIWFKGWAHYLQGEYAAAEHVFASYLEAHPRGSLVPRISYWRGRTLERLGREREARVAFLRSIEAAPTDWYGLLAASRLPEPPAPRLAARPADRGSRAGKGLRQARLARAEALYALGFLDEAGREFDAAVEGKADPAFLRAAAHLALEAGDPHRAYRLSWRLGGLRSASNLAYPRAFPEAFEAVATRSGLDPLLLLSIARQESGFSTTVRSPRGAVGLMQLLPSTAERLGRHLGLDADPGRLEDPRTNLTFGAAYLAALMERFGHPCLAVAAYNAGPAAVVGWLEDPLRKELALDEWVEAIPWRETRNYVKAVVGNWTTFRALEKKPRPQLAAELPEPGDGVDF